MVPAKKQIHGRRRRETVIPLAVTILTEIRDRFVMKPFLSTNKGVWATTGMKQPWRTRKRCLTKKVGKCWRDADGKQTTLQKKRRHPNWIKKREIVTQIIVEYSYNGIMGY